MAYRIVWSQRAQSERQEILEFWVKHNGSPRFSIRLQGIFKEVVKSIKVHPEAGRITDIPNVRIRLVREYQIYYQVMEAKIVIMTIWDSRRDPSTFKL